MNKKTIYLFGITEINAKTFISEARLEGMFENELVYSIEQGKLLAIVCEVPQDEFNEVKIQELSENRDWLEDKAQRHQRVITAVMPHYGVIPMRFCTLYRSLDRLKVFLDENYTKLDKLLVDLKGKSEWGLKLYLQEDSFRNCLKEQDDGIKNLINEISQNESGKGYFLKKKLENKLEEELEQKAFNFAEEVHRQLSSISNSSVLNKLMAKEVTGRREKMILNGSYLLQKGFEEQFFSVVNGLEEKGRENGFIFEISGPWPCYNFCRM